MGKIYSANEIIKTIYYEKKEKKNEVEEIGKQLTEALRKCGTTTEEILKSFNKKKEE